MNIHEVMTEIMTSYISVEENVKIRKALDKVRCELQRNFRLFDAR